MLKKIIASVIAFGILLMAGVSFAQYPEHLKGKENYVFCYGHRGVGWYVDVDSLNVELYNPPYYAIAINVATVQDADKGNTDFQDLKTKHFYYEWDVKKIYLRYPNSMKLLNPQGTNNQNNYNLKISEKTFELAYGIPFNAR